jgi:hypothetical protein
MPKPNIEKTVKIAVRGLMYIEGENITVEIDGEQKNLADLLSDLDGKEIEMTVSSSEM